MLYFPKVWELEMFQTAKVTHSRLLLFESLEQNMISY